ncbi:hypothetical protein D3C71_1251750 [compost metagenome]
MRQAQFDRRGRRIQCRADQGFAQHAAGIPGLFALAVLVHQFGGKRLVQRAPVGADAHGLVVLDGELDQLRELGVLLLAEADIARIDAVLGQGLGARRFLGQQLMAVVVEVADQGHINAHHLQLLDDARDCRRRFGIVDGQPHHFRTGAPQLGDLLHAAGDVGGIGIGHRLDDHGMASAHQYTADVHGLGDTARPRGGVGRRGRSGNGVVHGRHFTAPAATSG